MVDGTTSYELQLHHNNMLLK